MVLDADPGEALVEGLERLLEIGGLTTRDLATALAEGGPYAYLLRFSHTDPERNDAAGYSVTLLS